MKARRLNNQTKVKQTMIIKLKYSSQRRRQFVFIITHYGEMKCATWNLHKKYIKACINDMFELIH